MEKTWNDFLALYYATDWVAVPSLLVLGVMIMAWMTHLAWSLTLFSLGATPKEAAVTLAARFSH